MAGTSTGNPSSNQSAIVSIGDTILNPPKPKTLSWAFGEAAKNEGVGLLSRALYKAMGPWTIITDIIGENISGDRAAAEAQAKYIAGIKHLAEKKVPGFEYREMDVNGKKVIIAVDFTSRAKDPEAKPYIWTNADKPENPAFKSKMDEIADKANMDVEAFRMAEETDFPNKKAKYKENMLNYLEEVEKAPTAQDVETLRKPEAPITPDMTLWQQITSVGDELKSGASVGPDDPRAVWIGPAVGLLIRAKTRGAPFAPSSGP